MGEWLNAGACERVCVSKDLLEWCKVANSQLIFEQLQSLAEVTRCHIDGYVCRILAKNVV